MPNSDALISWAPAIATGLSGLALGAFFFGGLWWTVLHVSTFRRPALSVLASMMLRTSLTVAGIYLVVGGQWQRLMICLLGFVVSRALVIRVTGLKERHATQP